MPVGYVHKGYLDRDCLNEELYVTRNRVRDDQLPLYTHSAPSDADRLAEALRELVVACEEHDAMVSRIIGHPAGWNAQYLNSARQALAAHSAEAAQAQAQSGVSDEILKKALEISRSVGIETGHLAKSPDEQRMRAVLQAITPLLAAAPQQAAGQPGLSS